MVPARRLTPLSSLPVQRLKPSARGGFHWRSRSPNMIAVRVLTIRHRRPRVYVRIGASPAGIDKGRQHAQGSRLRPRSGAAPMKVGTALLARPASPVPSPMWRRQAPRTLERLRRHLQRRSTGQLAAICRRCQHPHGEWLRLIAGRRAVEDHTPASCHDDREPTGRKIGGLFCVSNISADGRCRTDDRPYLGSRNTQPPTPTTRAPSRLKLPARRMLHPARSDEIRDGASYQRIPADGGLIADDRLVSTRFDGCALKELCVHGEAPGIAIKNVALDGCDRANAGMENAS